MTGGESADPTPVEAPPSAPGGDGPARGAGPTSHPYRWAMLAGVWGVYAAFGLVTGSLAPVIEPILDDLGIGRGAMGAVLGAWQLVYLAAAIPAGRVIDRLGLRTSLTVAAAVIALSAGLRAVAVDLPTLFLAVAVFGLGGPLVSIGAPKLISVWFDEDDRRTAVGVYTTGPGVGAMVAFATANSVWVPLTGSWRGAVGAFAVLAAVAGLVWAVVAGRAPFPERGVADAADEAATGRRSTRSLLRLGVVRVVLALAVGSFLFSHAVGNWLVEILREQGLSASAAGVWAALTTVVGLAATVAVPRAATPHRRVPLLGGLYVLGATGLLAVVTLGPALMVPGLVAVGVARAGAMPVAVLVLMDDRQVGPANMAAAGGLYFTAGEIGGVLGPLLTGVLAEASGGFALPAAALSSAALAMALLSTRLPRPTADA